MSRPRKYSEQQVELMKQDYYSCGVYREVARRWRTHPDTVKYLIDPEYHKHKNKKVEKLTEESRPRPIRVPDPHKLLVWGAKKRSRESGVPFSITPSDISIPTVCPVLGIPLVYGAKIGKPQPGSLSLDRIIPELGYVRGNVRIISFRANTLKSDATLAELFLVLQDARLRVENV